MAVSSRRSAWWSKALAGLAIFLLAVVLVLAFFPWDWLRGPLNRYVSDKTGRKFEITRKLDVKLGLTTRVLADGIAFANPEWAQDSHLVKAESAEIDIRLWPLLKGRVELPLIRLRQPQLGLQIEPDGRRSWALGRDTAKSGSVPDIGTLVVDQGTLHFVAADQGADIRTEFSVAGGVAAAPSGGTESTTLPLSFKALGTWRKEPFSAEGKLGNVLHLSAPLQQPFPAQVSAVAGNTTLRVSGSIASLATLDGADAAFSLQGRNLAELYKLVGVVLPETPRYSVRGQVSKKGPVWDLRDIEGKLGNSDIAGMLTFNRSQAVPRLAGELRSKALDFDDLAPLVGLPEQPRKTMLGASAGKTLAAGAPAGRTARAQPAATAARDTTAVSPGRKVLPTAVLDLARLKAMNADVRYSAARVTNVRQLPLERGSVHALLKDGVLQLEQLDLGVAGGRLAGHVRIDGNQSPAPAEIKLGARSMELNKLFPGFKLTQASFGRIRGDVDLKARGNSVAQILATSSGNVALLMGRGQISNMLLELAGLDGAEIIKFFVSGDQAITLRCAATAFDVKQGLMTTRAFVLDTADTVINGTGTISLADEAINLTLSPMPKDASILSLRSPLTLAGSFAAPKAGVDKGAIAGRAGIALALAAINPLLALAATIETGPGKDADCEGTLREAATPGSSQRAAVSAKPPAAAAAKAPEALETPALSGRSKPHYPLDKPASGR